MLAHFWNRFKGARPFSIKQVGRTWLKESASWILLEDATFFQVDVVEHGLAGVDGGDGNSKQRSAFYDLGGRVLRGPGANDFVPLVHLGHPRAHNGPVGFGDEVWPFDHEQEVSELLIGVGIESDPAIFGRFYGWEFN